MSQAVVTMDGQELSLAAMLERFDRKERNWLLRTGLRSLELSPPFLKNLETVVRTRDPGFGLSGGIWWAIDYHFDWLVAALHLMKTRASEPYEPVSHSAYTNRQVEGTQQDIDLVVATGNTLVLIEAKGVGSWNSVGIREKIKRLERFGQLLDADGVCGQVRVHFALCSPDEPAFDRSSDVVWPAWTRRVGGTIPPWLKMRPNGPENGLLTVCRWNSDEKRSGYRRRFLEGSPRQILRNLSRPIPPAPNPAASAVPAA